jgi:catechol 2,3-dioxygenase-like lactoylglutathione lyase family enzyme
LSLKVQALDHLVVNVADVEASAAWYGRVLGMTRADVPPAAGKPPRTEMRFGEQKINLRPREASKEDWFTADQRARAATTFASSRRRSPTRSFGISRRKGSQS